MLDQIEKIEGLLNTFGTLVNDLHPAHVPTLNAVYAELAVLKAMIGAPSVEVTAPVVTAIDEEEY